MRPGLDAELPAEEAIVLSADESGAAIAAAPIFVADEDSLIDRLAELVAAGGVNLVVTLNVDQTLTVVDDADFRRIVVGAELRVLDGMPLVLLARRLGAPDPSRIAGSDLLIRAAGEADARGWRIALTGGDEDVSRQAAERLATDHPGAVIKSIPFPRLSKVEDPHSRTVVRALREFAPSIVFVGLGAPKQELWIDQWRSELPNAVYVGSGGSVAFVGGGARRAPKWVQGVSLEWAWRLAHEPRRLARRYLIRGPRFIDFWRRSVRHARHGGHR